jgi:hypothetical protein
MHDVVAAGPHLKVKGVTLMMSLVRKEEEAMAIPLEEGQAASR